MNRRNWLISIAGLVAAVLLYGLVGSLEYADEIREFEHYCRMITLHERSGGELGWPDYRGLAEQCKSTTEATP